MPPFVWGEFALRYCKAKGFFAFCEKIFEKMNYARLLA
jgi:hypothetical protein